MANSFEPTLFEKIKIYIKHPSCIKSNVLWFYRKKKENLMYWLRKKLISYELKQTIFSLKYENELYDRKFNYAIFNPCQVVMMVLARYFKHPENLFIHGIVVSTNDANENVVCIHLVRCGILIGKSGETIDAISNELTNIFGRKTTIEIKEVKDCKDLDLVRMCYEY